MSLYDKASSADVLHPLSDADRSLFTSMNTTNFERILGALSIAEAVNKALGLEWNLVRQRYKSIQRALAEAVRAVHVPWHLVSDKVLDTIRSELLNYRLVYSTNYDLLLYWAVMRNEAKGFKDYFWAGERFDITNTKVWEKSTLVHYLHGALHLYRLPTGEVLKRKADNRNLLDLFGTPYQGAVPLFVSEGASKEKLTSIHRSDYLSFMYKKFSDHEGNLVVFGHRLDETDAHLVEAMKKWGPREIAVSMRRGSPHDILRRKATLQKKLPQARLHFFNAETHPLGSSALRVQATTPDTLHPSIRSPIR